MCQGDKGESLRTTVAQVWDGILILAASARVSRIVTSDLIGEWILVRPAETWAERHERSFRAARRETNRKLLQERPFLRDELRQVVQERSDSLEDDEPLSWQARLVSGLHCPFCIGFWITAGVVGTYVIARRSPRTLKTWRAVTGILGANYVTGHIASRID